MKTQHDTLNRSIGLCLFGFLALHSIIFIALALHLKLPIQMVLPFLLVLFVYHVLLVYLLVKVSDLFVYGPGGGSGDDHRGEALDRINLVIAITLSRLTSLPSMVFLIILFEAQYAVLTVLILYTALAFITDFLDGRLARRLQQDTLVGAYLDSVSDYALLLAISIAYIVFDLLSNWFLVLVMVRLLFQGGIAIIISALNRRILPHRSSLIAKMCVFFIMLIYASALFRFTPLSGEGYVIFMRVLEWIALPVLLLSLGEKMRSLVQYIRDYCAARRSEISS